MAISFTRDTTISLNSIYNKEYITLSSSIIVSYPTYYFKPQVNVYNSDSQLFAINPNPNNGYAPINIASVVRLAHTNYFAPNISTISAIGHHDLYEVNVDCSGMTGATIIEDSTGTKNKYLFHNHSQKDFSLTNYILNSYTKQFLNNFKSNKISSTGYATIYSFNGEINIYTTYKSQIVDLNIVAVDDTNWKWYQVQLSSTYLYPEQDGGSHDLNSMQNFKLSYGVGPMNLKNYSLNIYERLTGLTSDFTASELETATRIQLGLPIGSLTTSDIIHSGVTDYYVWVSSGFTSGSTRYSERMSEIITYQIDNCVKGELVRLAWLNNLGGYDYFDFKLKTEKGYEIENKMYDKTNYIYYSNSYREDETKRVQTIYNQKATEKWVVYSNNLSDAEIAALKYLFISTDVYMLIPGDGQFVPIQLTNNNSHNFTKTYEKLNTIEVEFILNGYYKSQF